ncbi:unnamed protein product [Somion occarium]|uniref:PUM-HD domain-containing protein n=1 Tax=Somion occarium TaxID=3059160 RepID=A0ABP1CJ34_9APHY
MESSAPAHQPFNPFFDNVPSSRQMSSSIWAPQPQLTDTAWSRAIDSINRVDPAAHAQTRPEPSRAVSYPTPRNGEDVFGPLASGGHAHKKDVGAIGDGRKKSNPDFDHMHVEQLLRTLNLNSPAPLTIPPLTNDYLSSASPDLSPVSTTSALLTPTDLSPAKSFSQKMGSSYDFGPVYQTQSNGLMFETGIANRYHDIVNASDNGAFNLPSREQFLPDPSQYAAYEAFPEQSSNIRPFSALPPVPAHNHAESGSLGPFSWNGQRSRSSSEWLKPEVRGSQGFPTVDSDLPFRSFQGNQTHGNPPAHEPINFLSLLHPSSTPPYHLFVSRIIKSSDQQASIFLQQKLKVADQEERAKIVDAICARGFEMMAHRFGNWAVQRCLEASASVEERRQIVACMRGRVVDLATNCYGCHVLQKALDCEEDIRLLIVSELLLGDPAQTLVNKHASHVWSKIMELTWTLPAPPIFAYVNKSLKGKWASLACHETGSLVVQHAFENLEEAAKDGIVNELLNQGPNVFGEVAKSQWGSYCVQHILEHGSADHREMALDHIISGLLEYATNEQGAKSITKALKEGGQDTLNRIIKRMCEPAKGARRATIVDLALSVTGSQLIASVLPNADKDQRALLYDSIRGHIVTLRGCKTGSKVIWLFDRMRAYYGY